ncbi:MAG TPA: hydrogenase formation protein HypD [Nitrospirota bacterium]|nr:hydrogenase formation protein HypD [Nitrospirota bacterium]
MKILLDELKSLASRINRPLKLMEVCGTHTVEIFRHGIRSVIPPSITLLSGPGCPVCVTSIHDVDAAIWIAKQPGTVLVTFGDMMRVPGGKQSLMEARSEGADVQIMYSPMDALKLAQRETKKRVVFFATGFETTSPLIAGTVFAAKQEGVKNFSVYSSHKTVPLAIKALLDSPDVNVDGFIMPGHVSTMIGLKPYEFIATNYKKPSVITGFEAQEIILGILMIVRQISKKEAKVENAYPIVVRPEGNPKAMKLLNDVFEPSDAYWRGIGTLPGTGLKLREQYREFDAEVRFKPETTGIPEPELCSCGDILRGVKVPTECPLFGTGCTPDSPVGPCMVSTEGSCAAYFKYGQR